VLGVPWFPPEAKQERESNRPKKKNNVFWKPHEDELLIKLYPSTDTSEVARILGRSEKSCTGRAFKLNLKKTKEFLLASNRRRDLTLKENSRNRKKGKKNADRSDTSC
jgi:hypothetical protein